MNAKLFDRAMVSLKLSMAATVVVFVFAGLQLIAGWLVAIAVTIGLAASIPWIAAYRALRREEQLRALAQTSIQELYDEIQRSRYGYGDYAFKAEGESRFAMARYRAEEIQQLLRCRFAYLSQCRKDGLEPVPGAGWQELGEHAARSSRALKDAAYWCVQGIVRVNPDLLDPNWKAPADIHEGGLQALRARSLETKVVLMADFESLRRRRNRAKGARAPVVELASRAKSQST